MTVSAFEAALLADDLEALRACPKGDLHNHAILGGDRAFIRERTGRDIAPLDRVLPSMAGMHEWVGRSIGDIFAGPAGRLLAFEATLVQAKLDGVSRLDAGEDVWAVTLPGASAAGLSAAMRDIHGRVAPQIEWIPQLGLSRHCRVEDLMRWSAPFLELDFYRSLDLYGDEFAQPIGAFKPLFRAAKQKGLRLKAHVGEWGTADDVRRAVEELALDEVQHGIAAAQSPGVMRFLADHRIPLNICPTSNLLLGRIESLSVHPIRRLFDAGVIVTVNTDDVLVFGKSLSEEFRALHGAGLFSARELDRIRRNALAGAGAPGSA